MALSEVPEARERLPVQAMTREQAFALGFYRGGNITPLDQVERATRYASMTSYRAEVILRTLAGWPA